MVSWTFRIRSSLPVNSDSIVATSSCRDWRRANRPPKVAEETLPSTWALPSFAKDDRPDHPTPLDAFGIPMRQHVARGGLCYGPFCGSGSQIMASEPTGLRDGDQPGLHRRCGRTLLSYTMPNASS